MGYSKTQQVLVLTKDREVKKVFRYLSSKFSHFSFCIDSNLKSFVKMNSIKLIFTDYVFNLKELIALYPGIPIIVFTTERSIEIFKQFLGNGIELVLQKPLSIFLLESIIFKHMMRLKDQGYVRTYHGIDFNIDSQYLCYNCCKISLTRIETIVLSYLMYEEKYLTIPTLCKLVLEETKKDASYACLRVCITRLRKKFRASTGLNFIKKDRAKGYYITI